MQIRFWFLVVLFLFRALPAQAQPAPVAVITPAAYNKILNYLLISPQDVTLYKKIFRAQQEGDYDEASELEQKLENNILIGHVQAEKYLSAGYEANYPELKAWLEQYYDFPQAVRIYNLAGRKGGFEGLVTPRQNRGAEYIRGWDDRLLAKRSSDEKKYLRTQVERFRKALNSGKTRQARLVLEQPQFRRLAPDRYWDELAAALAMKYFVDNYNQLALQWATKAARRQTSAVGPWVAGLASWRMKQYTQAARYFSRLAQSGNEDEWLVAAGAYWAGRSYTKLKNPLKARQMFEKAAAYKHTFYGILAALRSGKPVDFKWDAAAYLNNFEGNEYVYELLASPHLRRAVILLHAKQPELAGEELRYGFEMMTPRQQEAAIFIAGQYNLHSCAVEICKKAQKTDLPSSYNRIAYPIPEWADKSVWNVDKALVLALIRQESAFQVKASSPAGAKGLMQLMPNTAFHITKDRGLKTDSSRLMAADYNLELGQRYVGYLLSKPFINGNLFYLMTAYNAGPGNLVKWQKNKRYGNDPLMFIEAIPSAQTRIYIERVMANYWIYNSRFNLPNPTLQQVAADKWPQLPVE